MYILVYNFLVVENIFFCVSIMIEWCHSMLCPSVHPSSLSLSLSSIFFIDSIHIHHIHCKSQFFIVKLSNFSIWLANQIKLCAERSMLKRFLSTYYYFSTFCKCPFNEANTSFLFMRFGSHATMNTLLWTVCSDLWYEEENCCREDNRTE